MSLRWRSVAPVTLTMALLVALAGCGGDNGAAGNGTGGVGADEDREEQQLVIYSGRNEELIGPLIERFEQETGITTRVRYGNTGQIAAQILEEGERSPADIYIAQDAGALGALTKAGRFEPLPADILDAVPQEYQAVDGTWVGITGRSRVIAYNADQLSEDQVPNSVFELTDERWRGQVGFPPTNASFEAFVTAMRVLEGDDRTREWLAGMAANDPELFDNNTTTLQGVSDGLVQLGLINHYYWYQQVAEEGIEGTSARMHYLPGGDPGSLVNIAGAGMLSGAANEGPALEFIRFLLSTESQTYFAEETKEYPLVAGVATAGDLPPLDSLEHPNIDLTDLDSLEVTQKMIEDAGLT